MIGFSRGSSGGRSVFVWPKDVGTAWARIQQQQQQQQPQQEEEEKEEKSSRLPRGVMFWNVNIDGGRVNDTNTTCWLGRGFNDFLRVRA